MTKLQRRCPPTPGRFAPHRWPVCFGITGRFQRNTHAVVEVLKAAKPLHISVDEHLFKNQEGQPLNFHTWRGGIWYRILRGTGIRERKPYSTRHTFISAGLSNDVNIKWLAEYCETSVTMIEKHYGKYIRNDADEQLMRFKTVTLTVPAGSSTRESGASD